MSTFKRRLVQLTVILSLYVLSYTLLSLCGGYRLVMSGKARPTGLAFSDTFVWQPRFGFCYPFHTATDEDTHHMDPIGFLYYPLICLDQDYFHKSRPFISLQSNDLAKVKFHEWPPLDQMHPVARKIIQIADLMQERYKTRIDDARARKDHAEVSRLKEKMRAEAEQEFGVKL